MNRLRGSVGSGASGFSPLGALLDIELRRNIAVVNGLPQTIAGTTTSQNYPSVGTFTRASVADWLNSAGTGLETQAASGALRREAVRGALIEEARTNIFLNSFAPATQTITVVNGTTYTVSRGTGAGTVTLSGALTGTPTQALPVTGAAGSTSLTVTVSGAVAYVNVEASSVALSPISTAGGSATRAADVLSVPVSLAGDFTAVVVARANAEVAVSHLAILGTHTDAFRLRRGQGTPANLLFESWAGGASIGSAIAGTLTPGTRFAVAARHNGGVLSGVVNGGTVVSVTPASLPPTPAQIVLGQNGGSGQFWNDFIERVIVFPTAVSDATLQSYSTLATWGG